MNYKNLGKILGKIMIMEGLLMLAPLLVSLIYGEDIRHKLAFLLPAILLGLLGGALQLLDPKRTFLYQEP